MCPRVMFVFVSRAASERRVVQWWIHGGPFLIPGEEVKLTKRNGLADIIEAVNNPHLFRLSVHQVSGVQ